MKSFVSAPAILAKAHIALLSAGLALAAPAVRADEISGDEKLGPIVVTATRADEGVPANLIGASITVLDAPAIEERQTRVLSDVLRDVPGVAVNRTGAIGGFTQVRVRGTEANHVLVLIDGIEASDPFFGEYDFGTLLADESVKVEVLRGQQSALYGSDAIGGVIQYITLSGAEAPGLRLRGEGGSFGTGSASARFAGVQGDWDYALSSTYLHTDGRPTAVGGERDIGSNNADVSAKTTWSPVDNVRVHAVGRYSHTRADLNESDSDADSPRYGLPTDTPGDHFKNDAFYGLLSGELALLDDHWHNTLSTQLADTRRSGYSFDERTNGDQGQRYKSSFVSTLRIGDDAVKQHVTAAADVEREKYRNLSGTFGGFTNGRHNDNVGYVGEYGLLLNDAWSFSGSFRHDRNDLFAGANTYRVQANWLSAQGLRLHAATGSGIKNPGFYELYGYFDGLYIGNPDLKPEKSRGWEAGVDQTWGASTLGATFFHNRLHNEIVTIYPLPDFVATSVNQASDTHQQGVETYLSSRVGTQWRLDAAYTYLHAETDGAVAVRRPKHIASLNATFRTPDSRTQATLTVRYNGRQQDSVYIVPGSSTPTIVTLGSYALVNLNAQYELMEHWSLLGRVENLGGKRYQEQFGYATTGRGFFAGVRASF